MADPLDERELRIAPVMTGGTSLAVWMGGVTTELYRMFRSYHEPADLAHPDPGLDVYRELLGLTNTRPVVDVVTGTSAGGLNGSMLTAAIVLNLPAELFKGVRNVWLEVADLQRLLRKASERDPPSLLQGDGYFTPKLREVLSGWNEATKPHRRWGSAPAPIVDLVTTVTTVTPEPKLRADDFGEPMAEVDHAQTIRFRTEDFTDDAWLDQMSVTARTSASIPGVFEASFLPIGAGDARASKRPDFEGLATFSTSRWAVDGGVVVNLPLPQAVDRIYDRSATAQVRRVVLFVSPTPSSFKESVPDAFDAPPNISTSLMTIVNAPRDESISSTIDQLRVINASVQRQVDLRRSIAQIVTALGTSLAERPSEHYPPTTYGLFTQFKLQRTSSSVGAMVERVRRANRGTLPFDQAELESLFRPARWALLPMAVNSFGGGGRPWGWGIESVDQAVSTALSLLSRAQQLAPASTVDVPEGDRAAITAAKVAIKREKATVHAARERVAMIRTADDEFWEARFTTLIPRFATHDTEPTAKELSDFAAESYALWPTVDESPAGEVVRAHAFDGLLDAHRSIAASLWRASAAIETVTRARGAVHDRHPWPGSQRDAQNLLEEWRQIVDAVQGADLLVTAEPTPDVAPEVLSIQLQLLRIHVVQTVMLSQVQSREQPIELMQVSSNSWNGIDDRTADSKLAGPELARLGAFLKPSWRANDWFWGRMDAAYRLVLVLLDPQRLRQLGVAADDVIRVVESITRTPLPAEARKELSFIASPTSTKPTPRVLEKTARHVAAHLQTLIAQEELPQIATDIARSNTEGGAEPDGGTFRLGVEKVRTGPTVPAASVPELVAQLKIGSDTVGTEFGSRLMNRTTSRAVSVLVNAVTGSRSGLPIVNRALRPLRVPIQAVNSLVGVMTAGSKIAQAATAFILAVAGAIVALRITGIDVPAGLFAISAILVTATFVTAMVRSGFAILGVWFLVVASVLSFALTSKEQMRSVLFDRSSTPVSTTGSSLDPGTKIVLPADGVLRVSSGSGDDERIEDIVLDGGGTLTLRTGGDVQVQEVQPAVAGWKAWGFIDTFAIARILLGACALTLLIGLLPVGSDRRRRRTLPWPTVLAALALGVLAAFLPTIAEAVLTGDANGAGAFKRFLVSASERLHGYELPVVLLIIVLSSLLVGLGADVFVRRNTRRLGAALRRARRPQAVRAQALRTADGSATPSDTSR